MAAKIAFKPSVAGPIKLRRHPSRNSFASPLSGCRIQRSQTHPRHQHLTENGDTQTRRLVSQVARQQLIYEGIKNDFWVGVTDNYVKIKTQSDEFLDNQTRSVLLSSLTGRPASPTMSHKAQILDLIRRLDDLPVRHEDLLKGFLVDLKLTIKDIFGPGNQYLDYLKFVKFRPEAVFVTEREISRSWLSGKAQIANLLRVILNDPLVRGSGTETEETIGEEEASIRRFSDIQDSIFGVLGEFQKDVLNRPAPDGEEGPIKDPLRKDFFEAPSGAAPASDAPALEDLKSQRVFVVPGSDQLINEDVIEFLNTASVEIVTKENDRRRGESLLDQLNRLGSNDFAVFVLGADFYFYPRTQSHESARLMGAQEVIFQLGYLVARLGRERVVVLYQELDHFRRPTDYFDIYYVPMSVNAGWKADLSKRMKACGITLALESSRTPIPGTADTL